MTDVMQMVESGGLLAFAALVYSELRALRQAFQSLATDGPIEMRKKLDSIKEDTVAIRERV
jgi:hypothetical protein